MKSNATSTYRWRNDAEFDGRWETMRVKFFGERQRMGGYGAIHGSWSVGLWMDSMIVVAGIRGKVGGRVSILLLLNFHYYFSLFLM